MKKEDGIYKKSFYCCDLPGISDGEEIFDLFLLSKVDYCSNDRAVKWFHAILSDRSGYMRAKIWSDSMRMEYEGYVGQVVLVQGRISYYVGRPELSIEKMRLMEEGTYLLPELCKALEQSKQEGYTNKILEMTGKIADFELKAFVGSILDEKVLKEMGRLPVNLKGHHAYRGALLEHTCEVAVSAYCQVCTTAVVRSIKCNVDLVIAGALLHDIASLFQYKAQGYGFVQNNTTRLIGRTGITFMALNGEKNMQGLGEQQFSQLIHIVNASHESATEPMTMEAMVVRNANRLSAELELYENTCLPNRMIYAQNEAFAWSKELKRMIYIRKDIDYGSESGRGN